MVPIYEMQTNAIVAPFVPPAPHDLLAALILIVCIIGLLSIVVTPPAPARRQGGKTSRPEGGASGHGP